MNRRGAWIHSAITDDNGEVDVGNLGLFALIGLVLGVIPLLCAGVIAHGVLAACCRVDLPFDAQALGIAVGAVCSGFATAIGGWGAARRLADNKGAIQTVDTTITRAADGSGQKTTQQIDAH